MAHVPQPRNKPDTRPRHLYLDESPPLLIRLRVNHFSLPAGFVFELPREESLRLIRRGIATAVAVGDFRTSADVVLTEEDYEAATVTA